MAFGDKLKALRIRLGKSQSEVAKEIADLFPSIRISQTSLSALEQRDTAPRQDVLEILARYYGVDVTYFYSDTDNRSAKAVEYLLQLKEAEFSPTQRFAHSSTLREENDEIEASLRKEHLWQPPRDVDEYLDT